MNVMRSMTKCISILWKPDEHRAHEIISEIPEGKQEGLGLKEGDHRFRERVARCLLREVDLEAR